MNRAGLVDYAASLDCIHCGLCLRTCPTYQLTGSEASSPRGRIYLMRNVAEGALPVHDPTYVEELDFCLVCRHCESVCPAGVRFGEMMEFARDAREREAPRGRVARLLRWFGFGVVLPSRWWTARAIDALRLAQILGLTALLARLAPARAGGLAQLPRVPPRRERRRAKGGPSAPAASADGRAVALLEGCVMSELQPHAVRAAARVIEATGARVLTSETHACCGALHAHNGDLTRAKEQARRTIAAFEALGGATTPIVVPSAGCSAHMRHFDRLLADDPAWSERARAFARRVEDFTLFAARELARGPRLEAPSAAPSVAFDAPCHLCHGQGIRDEPLQALDLVHGLKRVELPGSEDCCGSAGIYALLRAADSAAVFERKWAAFQSSGAEQLVTANPGCHMQWQSGFARHGSPARVRHIAEVLADALPQVYPD